MENRPLNRLNDFFFKNLMGSDKRSDLTLRFLNLILDRTKENEFKHIKFLNPNYNPLTLHFLELPKLKISDIKKVKRLEAWGAYFAGKCNQEEMEVLTMTEPLLKKALSYEKSFVNDDDMYIKYQLREDAIREENTKLSLAEKRGIKQGIEKGIQKTTVQNVINGLKANLDLQVIATVTGLSVDEVKKIQKTLL